MPKLIRELARAAILSAAILACLLGASAGSKPCPTLTQEDLEGRLNEIEVLMYDLHHPNSQAGGLSPQMRLEGMHRRSVERDRLWLTCSSSEDAAG